MVSKTQTAEMTLPWYQNDVVRLVAGSAFVAVTCIAAVYVAPVVMTAATTATVKAPVFALSSISVQFLSRQISVSSR